MTDALAGGRIDAPTILVVEDEPMIRLDVAEGLREFGFHVYEASDGVEALQILGQTSVNLVFSDVQMPGKLDGFDVARHVRSSLPQVPIVLTSGFVRTPRRPIWQISRRWSPSPTIWASWSSVSARRLAPMLTGQSRAIDPARPPLATSPCQHRAARISLPPISAV